VRFISQSIKSIAIITYSTWLNIKKFRFFESYLCLHLREVWIFNFRTVNIQEMLLKGSNTEWRFCLRCVFSARIKMGSRRFSEIRQYIVKTFNWMMAFTSTVYSASDFIVRNERTNSLSKTRVLGNLTSAEPLKKFCTFVERKVLLHNVCKIVHWSVSWAKMCHHIYLSSISIISSYIRLALPTAVYVPYAFLISPTHNTCNVPLPFHNRWLGYLNSTYRYLVRGTNHCGIGTA
jgi:hypothetical protein